MTVEFNKESTSPGDKVQLVAKATPGSQVAFLAVDKSVLLLNKDNDISRSEVSYDNRPLISQVSHSYNKHSDLAKNW